MKISFLTRATSRFGIAALLLLGSSGLVQAQEGCVNPTPNVEATPTPKPDPDPKVWTAGLGIGQVPDEDGNQATTSGPPPEGGKPIENGRMTAPQDQTVENPKTPNIKRGGILNCAVEAATDSDAWTQEDNDPCEDNPKGTDDDTVSYSWSASGGTFTEATNEASTKWQAPTTPGRYTITCTMDDKPADVEDPETGSRDDGAISRSCTVIVYSLSLSFVHGEVAAGNVNNDAHKATYTIHASDGQNPVPGVKVPTPTIKSGGLGPNAGVTASCTNDGDEETETDEHGNATGKMLSGNRTQVTAIEIQDEDASASVNQLWNQLGSEAWSFDPHQNYDSDHTVTYKMSYSLGPIVGHHLSIEKLEIEGWLLDLNAGGDEDGDGNPDGKYIDEPVIFRADDEDLTGWNTYQHLSEWGNRFNENEDGIYEITHKINLDENFIVRVVSFDIIDNDAYEEETE